jgi:hypothetical protein
VLSNPQILSNLFKDLLPDSPREAFVLVTAAEGDVAGMLRERVGQQLDPTSAVRLTATTLGEHCPIEPAASLWATTAFAEALGYRVLESSDTEASQDQQARGGAIGVADVVASNRAGTDPPPTVDTRLVTLARSSSDARESNEVPTEAPTEVTVLAGPVLAGPVPAPPTVGRSETGPPGRSNLTPPRPPPGPPVQPTAPRQESGRSRSRPTGLIVAIGLVAVAAGVVLAVLLLGGKHHHAQLSTTPAKSNGTTVTSTLPSTVPPASPDSPAERLVFEDRFTNTNSGWVPDANQGGSGTAAYVGGSYEVTALKPNPQLNTFSVHSPYEPRLTSMLVTVDATAVSGDPADGAGVRCDQGSRNGLRYSFEFHKDGTWVIFQLGGPGQQALSQGSSAAIRKGAQLNTVSGRCAEIAGGVTRLTMKANGVLLATVDNAHGGGPISWHGACVTYRSASSAATVVRFNDFRTYSVAAS